MLIARNTRDLSELEGYNFDTIRRNDGLRYIKVWIKTYNSVIHHEKGRTKSPYQTFWLRKEDVLDYLNWKNNKDKEDKKTQEKVDF